VGLPRRDDAPQVAEGVSVIVVRSGPVTVALGGEAEALARAAAERLYPAILGRIELEVDAIVADARDAWPIKTGTSRAGLARETRIDPSAETISVHLVNDVPYAIFVRPKKWHGATTAWQRLVRGPVGSLRLRLRRELGPAILEVLRAGLRAGDKARL
jgi:hypothetical protein